ncbi:MAG: HPF/RaiA family ribosome-associated protein [Candidatus Spechtbacteria bacterium]|nr:HPF/RaiA family ribosome-associated protein [Candidatus Spechtbacteria bacterium]
MKLNLKYTKIDPSNAVAEYVTQKIEDLSDLINVSDSEMNGGGATVEAWVEVGRTTEHHNKGDVFFAEGQIRLPGDQEIRAESIQPELHLAIDDMKDELQVQLKKYKEKQM